jgi:hypothetical protein
MQNHWLKNSQFKKFGKILDDLLMDTWARDESFGFFMDQCNDELIQFLRSLRVHAVDGNADEFIITLKKH